MVGIGHLPRRGVSCRLAAEVAGLTLAFLASGTVAQVRQRRSLAPVGVLLLGGPGPRFALVTSNPSLVAFGAHFARLLGVPCGLSPIAV